MGPRRSHRSLAVALLMALTGSVLALAPARPAAAEFFDPLAVPRRLVDTRPGQHTIDGVLAGGGLRDAGSTLTVAVAGRANVRSDAIAVVLNVTVDEPATAGFVTVFPCGSSRPLASNLDHAAGQTIAVLAVARLAGGAACIYTSAPTHLIVDVTGSFAAGELAPLAEPARLVDTRAGEKTVDGALAGGGVRGAGTTLSVPVAGRGGLPGGSPIVVLSVAVAGAREPGFVTVHACDVARPRASSLNYVVGQTVANLVVTRLDAEGRACVFTHGATDVVVDVVGSVPTSVLTPLAAPARLLDTRVGELTVDGRFAGLGRRPAGGTLQLPVGGRAGVPAGASAVLLNVTAIGAGEGHVTAFATGDQAPLASNLNVVDGQVVANAAIVRLGVGGEICLGTAGPMHVVVDVVGWLTGPPPAASGPSCPTQQIFPNFRIVALYGTDSSAALGVLGEQPPEAAAARLEQVMAPYRAVSDRPILGAFELIVTVAQAGPGPSGLYRAPSSDEFVQRYLDAARAHGLMLILDIQPGRSDFLTEVQRYEKFLRQPDVHLALDPEWRVGPNSVPGKVVGQVSAAEVNSVADWLAAIVAQEKLPEKLFVIHQFQVRMITDRATLRDPAGLAVTIHMDGFGTRGEKLNTYSFTKAAPPFHNGFKLFYDEDVNMFSPAETLALSPVPDLVTYQ